MNRTAIILAAALLSTAAFGQDPGSSSGSAGNASSGAGASSRQGAGHQGSSSAQGTGGQNRQQGTETRSRTEGGVRIGVESHEQGSTTVHRRGVSRRTVTTVDEPSTEVRQTTVKRSKGKRLLARKGKRKGVKVVTRSRRHVIEEPSVSVSRSTSVRHSNETDVSVRHRGTSVRQSTGTGGSVTTSQQRSGSGGSQGGTSGGAASGSPSGSGSGSQQGGSTGSGSPRQ